MKENVDTQTQCGAPAGATDLRVIAHKPPRPKPKPGDLAVDITDKHAVPF